MEGVGSRLGRASSRYGPATTVFNGPVRKWKKKWVHVSSSSTVSYQNPQSQSNGQNSTTSSNGGSRLLLCRWTPIPPSTTSSAADDGASVNGSGGALEEPPKRKFRYTPIAVLEEQKKVAEKKVEDEEKTSETEEQHGAKPTTTTSDETHGTPNINEVLKNETEVLEENGSLGSNTNISDLDLGLGLKGQDSLESLDQSAETEMKAADSTGFWSVG